MEILTTDPKRIDPDFDSEFVFGIYRKNLNFRFFQTGESTWHGEIVFCSNGNYQLVDWTFFDHLDRGILEFFSPYSESLTLEFIKGIEKSLQTEIDMEEI